MSSVITEPRRDWRPDWRRPSISQRGLAIGLTLLAEIVFLLILLGIGPTVFADRKPGQPTTVDLIPAAESERPQTATVAKSADKAEATPVPRPPTPRPPTPRIPPVPNAKSPFLELSREDFAAADIGKLGSAGGQGRSGSGETSASVGTGPGGVTLYQAEWYPRPPTDAELAGYLPKRSIPVGAWAEVACRTIPGNRVENCQSLGESPPGSGLGSAIRQAGWQFRIRPPRIDGKPQVGTWVKVHIEFTR